jgi:hypothetical protein
VKKINLSKILLLVLVSNLSLNCNHNKEELSYKEYTRILKSEHKIDISELERNLNNQIIFTENINWYCQLLNKNPNTLNSKAEFEKSLALLTERMDYPAPPVIPFIVSNLAVKHKCSSFQVKWESFLVDYNLDKIKQPIFYEISVSGEEFVKAYNEYIQDSINRKIEIGSPDILVEEGTSVCPILDLDGVSKFGSDVKTKVLPSLSKESAKKAIFITGWGIKIFCKYRLNEYNQFFNDDINYIKPNNTPEIIIPKDLPTRSI